MLAALSIDDDTDHHLRRVLRLRDGESVSVTDGAGRWLLADVVLDGSSLALEAAGEIVVEAARTDPFTIATAMPKGDRLDWLVQKVTELGADRIVLLHAERSVVRWKAARVESQLARLQRISDEACRQSRRGLAGGDRGARRGGERSRGVRRRRARWSSPRADGPDGRHRPGGWMGAWRTLPSPGVGVARVDDPSHRDGRRGRDDTLRDIRTLRVYDAVVTLG